MKEILKFHCPRYNELPNVFLYKDQVIIYLEQVLKPLNINMDEKIITPTMINNYVKQRIVSPPKDKKYNKKHLAYLIIVCILKQVFSLHEICKLINIQINKYPTDIAYDYFCTELEKTLKAVFESRDFSAESSASKITYESELARSAIMSFVNKIYTQKCIEQLQDMKQM